MQRNEPIVIRLNEKTIKENIAQLIKGINSKMLGRVIVSLEKGAKADLFEVVFPKTYTCLRLSGALDDLDNKVFASIPLQFTTIELRDGVTIETVKKLSPDMPVTKILVHPTSVNRDVARALASHCPKEKPEVWDVDILVPSSPLPGSPGGSATKINNQLPQSRTHVVKLGSNNAQMAKALSPTAPVASVQNPQKKAASSSSNQSVPSRSQSYMPNSSNLNIVVAIDDKTTKEEVLTHSERLVNGAGRLIASLEKGAKADVVESIPKTFTYLRLSSELHNDVVIPSHFEALELIPGVTIATVKKLSPDMPLTLILVYPGVHQLVVQALPRFSKTTPVIQYMGNPETVPTKAPTSPSTSTQSNNQLAQSRSQSNAENKSTGQENLLKQINFLKKQKETLEEEYATFKKDASSNNTAKENLINSLQQEVKILTDENRHLNELSKSREEVLKSKEETLKYFTNSDAEQKSKIEKLQKRKRELQEKLKSEEGPEKKRRSDSRLFTLAETVIQEPELANLNPQTGISGPGQNG